MTFQVYLIIYKYLSTSTKRKVKIGKENNKKKSFGLWRYGCVWKWRWQLSGKYWRAKVGKEWKVSTIASHFCYVLNLLAVWFFLRIIVGGKCLRLNGYSNKNDIFIDFFEAI